METLKTLYKIGRGPSSSHTMGPEIAAKNFLKKYQDANKYVVELYGSLSLTGKGHLTDYIILETMGRDKTEVKFTSYTHDFHENGMKFIAYNAQNEVLGEQLVFSVGGGEVVSPEDEIVPKKIVYPHTHLGDIINYCKLNKIDLVEYVKRYDDSDIFEFLSGIYEQMEETIYKGFATTGYLPGRLKLKRKSADYLSQYKNLRSNPKLLTYAATLAVSEENGSGGLVVTAPTCGASGVVPGVLFTLKHTQGYSNEQLVGALAVAGLVGNVVRTNGSISGAEAGCQAEIGVATSMAAAAMVYLHGGTIEKIEYAAEMGLEHSLGLTCDPVGGYVQIPCIERNVVKALAAINMAEYALLSSENSRFKFDFLVEIMLETGKDMKIEYRETSLGGLAKFKLKDE